MQDMTEEKFTIYAKWNDGGKYQGHECVFPWFDGEPTGLAERIEYVRNHISADNFIPVAWAPRGHQAMTIRRAIDDCIAAGRIIEKEGDKYVARGVEKPVLIVGDGGCTWTYDGFSMASTLDKLEAEKASFIAEIRALLEIQGGECNLDRADEYMFGIYNGLELALATAEGRDPQYRRMNAPQAPQIASTAKPAIAALSLSSDMSTYRDHQISMHLLVGKG